MSTWADEDRFYEETEAILRIGITVWDTKPRSASVQVTEAEKNGVNRILEDVETSGWEVRRTFPDGTVSVVKYATEEAAQAFADDWIAREDTSIVRETIIEISGPESKQMIQKPFDPLPDNGLVGMFDLGDTITRDDIARAVRVFTGRPAYIEHGGGGLEYLYAALDREGNYAWIGWADSHEAAPAMAEDPNGREIVVAGAMYRLSYTDDYPQGIADTYYGLEDEPVTESGLRVAVLKWVARAMAANVDPKTEWQSI